MEVPQLLTTSHNLPSGPRQTRRAPTRDFTHQAAACVVFVDAAGRNFVLGLRSIITLFEDADADCVFD
jgi:hypothetical protein